MAVVGREAVEGPQRGAREAGAMGEQSGGLRAMLFTTWQGSNSKNLTTTAALLVTYL